jgi:phosphate starvation-inducible membrane PsiE
VDYVLDLAWLSKMKSNAVEYLVDSNVFFFFFFYLSCLVHTIWRTRLFFPLLHFNIDPMARCRVAKSHFLPAASEADDFLRNV